MPRPPARACWTSAFHDHVHRREPVVFPRFQDLVVQGDPWGDHFGHTALDNGLGGFGVFELVADRHTVPARTSLGR